MDEKRVPIELRTKWEPGKIYSFSIRKCFIVIYSHNYVNLLQIIIKYIENEKVKCVFQNSWNDFVVSGFEVIALDDGIFQRSIVKKLAFNYVIKFKLTAVIYLRCYQITCLTILILSLLFKTRTHQNKCNFVQKKVHGKSWRHRTRLVLHGGVRWLFSAPEVYAEILVRYARNGLGFECLFHIH